jgi:formylglycine-generating enzyme required for sulfatase activity
MLPTLILLLISISCTAQDKSELKPIKKVETGINSESWVLVPAGYFLKGQHRHQTMVDSAYKIMVTDVTNEQYVRYLNEALESETITIVEDSVLGYYKGDPFNGFKHEFQILAGKKIYLNLAEPGIRIRFNGQKFTTVAGYENHPATFISWFGANAYAQFYGWRLPSEIEWEKAARGTDGRTYPWGEDITGNSANYLSSHTLFEKMYGEQITTTPVGFFNGKTYNGYETVDHKSPYGLYDMAGNVWQWVGDDYPDVHYRYLRGGSRTNYEYNLFVWARNSAGPDFYSMYIGFRCASDVQTEVKETVAEKE